MPWTVYFHSGARHEPGDLVASWLSGHARAAVGRVRAERYAGQPFVLDEFGPPDPVLNSFFASRGFRGYAAGTRKKYALSVTLWLNFCVTRDLSWLAAERPSTVCSANAPRSRNRRD